MMDTARKHKMKFGILFTCMCIGTCVVAESSTDRVEPKYCVIDLSGGTSASSYPFEYLADVPSGGWTDEHKTTKLVLRKIKAGTFTMGSSSNDYPEASSNVGLHQVTLTKDYWMGVFEVTQRQWELVMGNRPSYFWNDNFYKTRPVEKVSYDMIRGSTAGAGWPTNSAVDSVSFLGVLRSKTTLEGLDLPTEAQWEYACRAGTTTALNNGKNVTETQQYSDPAMDEVGRYWFNCEHSLEGNVGTNCATAKVGSYKPNDLGLYDMHGNVREWCLDWYEELDSADATDPKGPTKEELATSAYRILRGGCYYNSASSCCSASRQTEYPKNSQSYYGFRLCCSEISPFPDFGDSPTEAQVSVVVNGAEDARLAKYVTNGVEYVAYRTWATNVQQVAGGLAGTQMVYDSPHAWLSYAMDSAVLVTNAPVQGEMRIASFEKNETTGKFDFLVAVDGITVGAKAAAEKLATLFTVEGSETVDEGYLTANVVFEFGTPSDGKVQISAMPNDEDAVRFFIKAKMNP